MCEVGRIVLVLEGVAEAKAVVRSVVVDFDIVFGVGDIFAATSPKIVCGLFTVGYFHAILKGGIGFDEIEYVESNLASEFVVVYTKEEPLCAACRVDVFVKKQVVLI